MKPIGEERLRFILIFTALYGVILFLTRPDPTRAQDHLPRQPDRRRLAGLGWLHLRSKRRESLE
jgi:hypothetical protein